LRLHVTGSAVELVRGRFGIDEPGGTTPEVAPAEVAVMVVPGLAFDAAGRRLGFGGGYYDELLAAPTDLARRPAFVVGFGYDFQVVDNCPADERDGRVDCVVTEARVIHCAGTGVTP
jgi:5-formyltetrahydrofolate cyclo-ligase